MRRKWLTLTAVCIGAFMLLLDVTIVNVALPDIQSEFGGSLTDSQWVIDAYALALAAVLLMAGTIADIVGRRIVFATGVTIFTIGSLVCGLAPNILTLIIARVGQGVGGAIMFATALALLAQAFPPRERGVAFGIFGAVTGVSVAIGPVLGGVLTSGLSWHWIFYVNIPVGIVALLITVVGVDESKAPEHRKIDWWGALTFSAALAFIVLGLIRSHGDGWGSPSVAGSLVAGAVLLAVFALIERVSTDPMVDGSLFRIPTFSGGLIAAWAVSASMFSMLTYIVIYLQNVMGYTALHVGLYFLPFSGLVFVTASIAGRVSDKVPVRWLIAPGFLLVATGLVVMRGSDPSGSWTHFIPGFVIAGVGTGMINVPLTSTAVGVVDPARAGMASGMNSTFRQIGVATGVAVLGTVLASHVSSQVVDRLAGTPLAAQSHMIGNAVANGGAAKAVAQLPHSAQESTLKVAANAYSTSLDVLFLVAASIAVLAAITSIALIRSQDFHHVRQQQG